MLTASPGPFARASPMDARVGFAPRRHALFREHSARVPPTGLDGPLSVSAAAGMQRGSVALTYLDVVLVLLVAVPALALGAPALGYTVGAAAWILQRGASVLVDRRLEQVTELRRRLGLGVTSSMLRVWLLAVTIIVVGVAGERADGLTAALVIFTAFSVYFVHSAIEHASRKRQDGS